MHAKYQKNISFDSLRFKLSFFSVFSHRLRSSFYLKNLDRNKEKKKQYSSAVPVPSRQELRLFVIQTCISTQIFMIEPKGRQKEKNTRKTELIIEAHVFIEYLKKHHFHIMRYY